MLLYSDKGSSLLCWLLSQLLCCWVGGGYHGHRNELICVPIKLYKHKRQASLGCGLWALCGPQIPHGRNFVGGTHGWWVSRPHGECLGCVLILPQVEGGSGGGHSETNCFEPCGLSCPLSMPSPELVMASAQGLPGHTQLPGEADRGNIWVTVGVWGSALFGEE